MGHHHAVHRRGNRAWSLCGPRLFTRNDRRSNQQGADDTGARRRQAAGAVFAMERLLDRVAHELQLDRAEVRHRNFIKPEQMPYAVGLMFRDGPTDYEITEAENGEEALAAIAKQRPDLILMDIQLPI